MGILIEASGGIDHVPQNKQWLRFVEGFLFLNIVHSAFTFAMLHSLPSYRKSWRANGQGRAKTLTMLSVFFGFTAAGLLAIYWQKEVQATSSRHYFELLLGIVAFYGLIHGFSQSAGISQVLLHTFHKPSPAHLTTRKKTLQIALPLIFLLGLVWLLRSESAISFLPTGTLIYLRLTQHILSPLLGVGILIILALSFMESKRGQLWTTFLFDLRLIPYAILFLMKPSFYWSTIIAAAHGTEYLIIALKSYRCEKSKRPSENATLALTTFTLLVSCVFILRNGLFTPPWLAQMLGTEFLTLIYALTLGISAAHYYADSVLFRARDPEVRHSTIALLATPIFTPAAQPAPLSPESQNENAAIPAL